MQIVIPIDSLQPDTLRAVIEEFVTRHGAVHGHSEAPLDEQIESVRLQLRSGRAVLVFDEEEETCTICRREDLHSPRTNREDSEAIED